VQSDPHFAVILFSEVPADRTAETGSVAMVMRRSVAADRDVVCGLLMEQLQDVGTCFIFYCFRVLMIAVVTFCLLGTGYLFDEGR
jgi:energy-converting hydrogenase Eha subunit E